MSHFKFYSAVFHNDFILIKNHLKQKFSIINYLNQIKTNYEIALTFTSMTGVYNGQTY